MIDMPVERTASEHQSTSSGPAPLDFHKWDMAAGTEPVPAFKNQRGPAYRYKNRRALNILALVLGDMVAFFLALGCSILIEILSGHVPVISPWVFLLLPLWCAGAYLIELLPGWGLGSVEELRRIAILFLITFGVFTTLLILSDKADTVSRPLVTLLFAFGLFTVPACRIRVKRILLALGYWGIPVSVYGAGEMGSRLVRLLERERGLGYKPVALFDDDPYMIGKKVGSLRVSGITRGIHPDAFAAILAIPGIDRTRLVRMLDGPLSCYPTVLVIPDLIGAPSLWIAPRDFSGTMALELASNLPRPAEKFLKRFSELLVVLLLTSAWLPLCLLATVFIWLEDRHCPFFVQERVGKDGRIFQMYKLRTMVPDAEDILSRWLENDTTLQNEWLACHKLRHDDRITRVGKILRRFSIDELPQLVNVMRGEMSLVGPRPLPQYHHDKLSHDARLLRERIRPGITGLWQISGRSEAGIERMEEYDVHYVRNWSLWLDAIILVRTFRSVIEGKGAF